MLLPDRFEIGRPDNMHVHLRDDERLSLVAPFTCRQFGRAVIMPNDPEILTAGSLAAYERRIRRVTDNFDFRPLMTLKLTHRTTPREVELARELGAVGCKLYPRGVTHGSDDGIDDVRALDEVFRAMAGCGLVCQIHAEQADSFVLDREFDFLPSVLGVLERHPDLKVVLEHVSTAVGAEFVASGPDNIFATVTPVHLTCTLDDIIGHGLRPHNFMCPVPKRSSDRDALIAEVCKPGQRKFGVGTDSAPHDRSQKERPRGCAGVFSEPVALSVYAAVFERWGAADTKVADLERFCSRNGADFYGLPYNEGTITLARDEWVVPTVYRSSRAHWGKENPLDEARGGVEIVPFLAGEVVTWRASSPASSEV
jgi:dihydroorotase